MINIDHKMNQSRTQILCQYKITDCPPLIFLFSLFVSFLIPCFKHILIVISEIGTGFYVEKKSSETNEFLERKLKIVDANSENITKAVQATSQNIDRYVAFFYYREK